MSRRQSDIGDRHRHAWQPHELRKLLDLVSEGLPVPDIAEALGRSRRSVLEESRRKFGGIRRIRQGLVAVRTATAVAELFGVKRRVIQRWVALRLLNARRNRSAADRGGSRHYLFTDTSIMRFMTKDQAWPLWDPQRITDPDWRDFAIQIREENATPDNQMLGLTDVGERLGYSPKTVRGWVYQGHLPAQMIGGKYYVRLSDFLAFVPPQRRAR